MTCFSVSRAVPVLSGQWLIDVQGFHKTLLLIALVFEVFPCRIWGHHTQLDLKAEAVRCHEHTGRPMGNDEFLSKLELAIDIPLRPRRPGPKRLEKG